MAGSLLVVVVAFYYTLTSVGAVQGTKGNQKFVTYDNLENILQPSLNVVWDSIEDIQNDIGALEQRVSKLEAGM